MEGWAVVLKIAPQSVGFKDSSIVCTGPSPTVPMNPALQQPPAQSGPSRKGKKCLYSD